MLRKTLIAVALSAISLAATAADYYLVAPVPGKTVNASAIAVSLVQSDIPGGRVGDAYSYDFKSHLQVTGDPTYTGFGVRWSLVSGTLPAGLMLNADTGVITGSPTKDGAFNFTAQASYKTKQASQGYALTIERAGDLVLKDGYRAWADGTVAASCKDYRYPTGKTYSGDVGDGVYRIQVGGLAQDVHCDMTTDGGGWTMWYSSSGYYHIATANSTPVAYGSHGYSKNLRSLPFREILYVQHSTGNKDWFTRDTAANIRVGDYIGANNVLNVTGDKTGTWTGKGGAATSYKYELLIGDYTWMQVGLMMSGHTSTCWKAAGAWCDDRSTNYYRINGEGNGVRDDGEYRGVAFRQNGHRNVTAQLMSVGVR